MADEIIKKEGSDYSIIRYIHRRIADNKNFLATITGPTGSGKSFSALAIAELTDKSFDASRIIFSAKQLMQLINNGDLKAGSVIVWDEAGINLSNRNWQSVTNKMLNALLQTFRHRNFILLFTVPYHDFIDIASRKLFHADFQTQKINKREETVLLKPKLLQYNSNLSKWYRKYLKVSIHGKLIKIKRWAVPKPSDKMIESYEQKKNEFTKLLNKEIENNIEVLEAKETQKAKKKEEVTEETKPKRMKQTPQIKEKEGTRLICPRCGYTWIYAGSCYKASCPSCQTRFPYR